jgi:hypothetical protein
VKVHERDHYLRRSGFIRANEMRATLLCDA